MMSMPVSPLKSFLPIHMLLVDDDPLVIDILQTHYFEMGFSVDAVAEGNAALAAIESRKPDVILCDRVMPGMSGAELLETLRGGGAKWQSMAFIFLTALTDRRDRYAMMPLRPDGYLDKPIDLALADQMVASILAMRRMPPQLTPLQL